jgi:hypothetical protein
MICWKPLEMENLHYNLFQHFLQNPVISYCILINITDYISNKTLNWLSLQNKLILVSTFLSIWPFIHSYIHHYTSSFTSWLLLKYRKFTPTTGGITLYTAYSNFFVAHSTKLLNLYQQFFLCRPGNGTHNSYYLFKDLHLYAWLHKYMHPLASGHLTQNCGQNKPCVWTILDTTGKWIYVWCISVALLMSANICN